MKVKVLVQLKTGVLDVQGKATERALHDLGFNEVKAVYVGKVIELEIAEPIAAEELRPRLEQMCKQVLANDLIERFEIIQ